MNVFEIESLRQKLLTRIPLTFGNSKIFLLYTFYSRLLESNNQILTDAYALEFINEYINALKHFTPFCLHPKQTQNLIEQLLRITNLSSIRSFKENILLEINRISRLLSELKAILEGGQSVTKYEKLSFPLIEKDMIDPNTYYGFIENVMMTVKKNKSENRLYVFPNSGEIDPVIETQVWSSFELAKEFLSVRFKKLNEFHELMIYFNNYSANYIGSSLGISLTIGFIEKLSELYNFPVTVKLQSNIASTGGVNPDGFIIPVDKDHIQKKTETVFYSPIEIFIVPKKDEIYALETLGTLTKSFPLKSLKIIGVEDLNDIINRRNLIAIKKRKPAARFIRTLKMNWQLSLLAAVIFIFASFIFFQNLDTNPAILESSGKNLFVKNKSGKVLWTKNINYDPKLIENEQYLNYIQKLVDINNDGFNEVIVCMESASSLKIPADYGRITCFDHDGTIIWKYVFRDTVSTENEKLPPLYTSNIIDTFSTKHEKYLLAIAYNRPSFSSCIYKLDLLTGQRVPGTLWHSGFIKNAIICDFDGNGKKEIAFSAVNNSYEKIAFGVVGLGKTSGQCPALPDRRFKNKANAKLVSYILFPKTDFNSYLKFTNPVNETGSLINSPEESCLYITNFERENPPAAITYKINYNWQDVDIIIGSSLRIERDTMVVHGILKPPLTNTNEYVKLLQSKILFWDGSEFKSNY